MDEKILQSGDRIGSYVVERTLGRGGMGQVYVALDVPLDRRVALKVIAPELAADPEFRERFKREGRALAAIDSSYVVHVYAAGEHDDRLYIATQLMPDGDLGRLVHARAGLPLGEAVGVVTDVGLGLAEAHRVGIVHRDIKPANVLLRAQGPRLSAALGDFGIARHTGAQPTITGANAMGTTGYMAPELHRGEAASVVSDVYAVGCLLWVALTGQPPYVGDTEYQVISGHLDGPVPQLEESTPTHAAINQVLRGALAKDPARRYASADALLAGLRAVPPPVASTGATAVRRPASAPVGRRPWVVAAAAVATLVVLGALGWAATRVGGDQEQGGGAESTVEAGVDPTTDEPTDEPTDEQVPSPGDFTAQEVSTARDSFARALEGAGVLDADQSRCAARSVLDEVGLAAMVADGFFDDDLAYVDVDLADASPEVAAALQSAALSCAVPG